MTEEINEHSIVHIDTVLRDGHVGEEVSYQGFDGKLIRYVPADGALLTLTLLEARECLEQNRAEDEP
jgi:hypothetical protein